MALSPSLSTMFSGYLLTRGQVMLKYLDKVKVISETAGNGEECTELVFSKEPGYYSLIIVSAGATEIMQE
jgi:hypothetical protein